MLTRLLTWTAKTPDFETSQGNVLEILICEFLDFV